MVLIYNDNSYIILYKIYKNALIKINDLINNKLR